MARRAQVVALSLAAMLAAAGCTGGSSSGTVGGQPITYRPHRSQTVIPFANGFAAAAYETGKVPRRVSIFLDHIYARRTATETSKDLLNELFFGYRKGGMSQWLAAVPEAELGYVPGTGIVRAAQRANDLAFETFYFTPMTGGAERALVALVRARNEGAAVSDNALFVYLDLHLGGDADATGEWVWNYAPGAFMEGKEGTGNRAVYRALGSLAHWAAGASAANDPLALVNAGSHLPDANDAQTPVTDVRLGLEADVKGGGLLQPGEEVWFGVAVFYADDGDEDAIKAAADAFLGASTPEQLLQREVAFWDAFHANEVLPLGATPDEIALLRQSTAILKMAQCREPGGANGQILASLPPGQWNITWVRDACYAIEGLVATGHHEEAKAALSFFLNGTAGLYQAEVGRPYALSICRYTGDGTEESDDNGNGPNIEYDGFGLFLRALAKYVEKSGDTTFFQAAWPTVRDGIADALVDLIQPNGLLKADSSIWERHLHPAPNTPDGAKQFAYTSIQAAIGLDAAAGLAALAGDGARAASYAQEAARIRAAIETELLLEGAICSALEEKALGIEHALDASVVDAFAERLFPATHPLAAGTMTALERLRVFGLLSPGYLRNDDAKDYGPDNGYDRQEWVVIDLRAASALSAIGRKADARVLIDWVTAQSRANFDLIAELYDESSADYRGAVPMAGFGGGTYASALFDYYAK